MDDDLISLLNGAGLSGLIKMPKSAFVKEHNKLIKLLRTSDDPRFQNEADEQSAELKRVLDSMEGGRKRRFTKQGKPYKASAAFIRRMMWETKNANEGKYQYPTVPAPDTSMNKAVAFKFSKLPNPSKFIVEHFGTVPAPQKRRGEQAALARAKEAKEQEEAIQRNQATLKKLNALELTPQLYEILIEKSRAENRTMKGNLTEKQRETAEKRLEKVDKKLGEYMESQGITGEYRALLNSSDVAKKAFEKMAEKSNVVMEGAKPGRRRKNKPRVKASEPEPEPAPRNEVITPPAPAPTRGKSQSEKVELTPELKKLVTKATEDKRVADRFGRSNAINPTTRLIAADAQKKADKSMKALESYWKKQGLHVPYLDLATLSQRVREEGD